jgi:hypothetical protein
MVFFSVGSQEQKRMLSERIEEAVRDTGRFMAMLLFCSRSGIGSSQEIRMNFNRRTMVIYE